MPAVYPGGIKTWVDKIDGDAGDDVFASHINEAYAELIAIETNLDEHKADNAKQIPHIGTTTNVVNDYSVTTAETIVANQKFTVKINAASTGAATLNVSSIGSAKGIKKPGGTDATLKIGVYTFFYDGVNFQLLGEGGEYGTAGAAQTLTGYTVGTDNGIVAGTATIKKWASGTATSSTTTLRFYNVSSGIQDTQFVTVAGLTFKPSIIILKASTSSVFYSIYEEISAGDIYGKTVIYGAKDGTMVQYGYHVKGDVSAASVTNTGFTLPVSTPGVLFYWSAFE